MTTIDKRLDTIAKLLAKAESTNFPHEAEALTEQAERMMVRYGIDKAALDIERGKQGQTREAVIEQRVPFTGTYRNTRANGFGLVVDAFGTCTTLIGKARLETHLYIIGAESDVRAMVQLVESLTLQSDVAVAAWWKNHTEKAWMTAREKLLDRRQFFAGYAHGARVRVAQMVTDELADENTGSGTELVLADRLGRAEEKKAEMYGEVREARQAKNRSYGSYEAQQAGRAAGMTANVNGKVLEGAS